MSQFEHLVAAILALAFVTLTLVACKKDDPPSTKPGAAASPSAAPGPSAAPRPAEVTRPAEARRPTQPPTPPAAALVDHDLASRGVAWAGWTIQGPPGSTLEADEGTFRGATAIQWGNGLGAVGFKQGKLDFAYLKKQVFSVGKTAITRETPDLIEATMEFAGTRLQCFYASSRVGPVDVGCWTAACVQTDAELATAHRICDSLARKESPPEVEPH